MIKVTGFNGFSGIFIGFYDFGLVFGRIKVTTRFDDFGLVFGGIKVIRFDGIGLVFGGIKVTTRFEGFGLVFGGGSGTIGFD